MSKARSKDIKKAIKAFIRHVESLESAVDQEENGFDAEYKLIQEAQARNRKDNAFPMDAGKSDNNLKKNRYKDILPYDDHRVVLSVIDGDQDSDYINASKLMGVRGTGGYIATQGPLASTVIDYWRMIWEYNVEIVFMACRIVELGKIKCKQYWNDVDKSENFGDITVVTEAEENIMSDCVRRNFQVTRGEEVRQVVQYHYSGWPDHGIPDDAGHIRDMIGFMRQTRHNDQAPLLVHCSAGCGRTGAIIAIDYVWTLLEEGKFDDTFSLFDLICDFREQRMSIVQTAEQYALVNKVLKSLCEEWLTKMASHTYENVALDQASDIDASSPDKTRKPGENIYKDGCTTNSYSQKGESDLNQEMSSLNKHEYENVCEGSKLDVSPPSEGKKINSAYEFVSQGKNQEDLVPQKPLPTNDVNNGRNIHKTIIQVDSGRSTKQAQTSDLGGKKLITPQSPSSPEDSDSKGGHKETLQNGMQAMAHPTKSQKPQHLPITAVHNFVNKNELRSPPEDAAAPNVFNKKTVKAPAPPAQFLKPQSPPVEHVYSVVNKPSAVRSHGVVSAIPSPQSPNPLPIDEKAVYSVVNKPSAVRSHGVVSAIPSPQSPNPLPIDEKAVYSVVNKPSAVKYAGAAPTFPSPKTPNPLPSDDKFVYSVISEVNSGAISTAYEDINLSRIQNIRSQSTSSVESSGGKNSNTSSGFLSLRQLNSGNIPGFNERLPRVRGPVPMPQSWNKI